MNSERRTHNAELLNLSSSVGAGGVNRRMDVLAVRERLLALGYVQAGQATTVASEFARTTADKNLVAAIRLFQAICHGRGAIDGAGVDGRVDPGGFTHHWLEAGNAPRWVLLPVGAKELGFFTWERVYRRDVHEWGTAWLADAIAAAGRHYLILHGRLSPLSPSPALITVNDCSLAAGGVTPAHRYHQTGLECDLRLPRHDGWAGEITWRDARYDRTAMRLQLEAWRAAAPHLLRGIFFNDPELAKAGLCTELAGHDDHAHVSLRAPARIDG